MTVDNDGGARTPRSTRAAVRNHAKLAYNGVAAWLEGEGPAPARLDAVSGLAEQLRAQDEAAQAMRGVRHEQGALDLETIEVRAVLDGETVRGLHAEQKNRAKELIEDLMIAANGVVARFLARHGVPSLRRVVRSPERWERIVALAAEYRRGAAGRAGRAGARGLPACAPRRRPLRFPDLSLAVIKLLGAGRVRGRGAGSGRDRPLRARGARLHALDRAQPPLSRPDHAAPGEGGARRAPDALRPWRARRARGALHRPRGCARTRSSARCASRRPRCYLSARVGDEFDAIVTGASEKGTWVRVLAPPVEGKVERGQEGLDVGDRVRVKLVGTDVERGFIDFVAVARRRHHAR